MTVKLNCDIFNLIRKVPSLLKRWVSTCITLKVKGNIKKMRRNGIKKVVVLSLAGVMSLTMFCGCGDKEKNASARKVVEYNIEDYVKLGAYTGLSVDENITIVTDDDVQECIDELVTNNTTFTEITDRNAQSGDRVTIDYIKSQEGEDDETNSDYTFELGSETMGEDFENNLVGLALNDTLTFTVQEDNLDSEGNTSTVDVTYTVTLTKIQEKVVPEVTDDFIAENSDYATIDEYKEGKRAELEESNASSAKSTAQSELLQMVVDASEVSGTPAFVYNMNYNALCQSYAQYASYFGTDLEGYLSMAGSSMDDLKNNAVGMTIQTLVIEAMVKDAGVDITDEQFDENLQVYVDDYGFESKEAVLETYTKEELLFDMRRDAAIDYLYENNTINQNMVAAE